MHRPNLTPLLLVAGSTLVAGCRIIQVGILTVAAAVGITGYVIYKTGDVAVTGVGKAGEAVVSGSKSVATVIYVNGELKVEHPFDLRTVWLASSVALQKARFDGIKGSFDALSGELTAKTREGLDLALKLRVTESRGTEVRVRVGVKGDLKAAELVNSLIASELPKPAPAFPASATAQEEKR